MRESKYKISIIYKPNKESDFIGATLKILLYHDLQFNDSHLINVEKFIKNHDGFLFLTEKDEISGQFKKKELLNYGLQEIAKYFGEGTFASRIIISDNKFTKLDFTFNYENLLNKIKDYAKKTNIKSG
jgi:hypothetical protein